PAFELTKLASYNVVPATNLGVRHVGYVRLPDIVPDCENAVADMGNDYVCSKHSALRVEAYGKPACCRCIEIHAYVRCTQPVRNNNVLLFVNNIPFGANVGKALGCCFLG